MGWGRAWSLKLTRKFLKNRIKDLEDYLGPLLGYQDEGPPNTCYHCRHKIWLYEYYYLLKTRYFQLVKRMNIYNNTKKESYASSIRIIVQENNLDICDLDTLKRLVYSRREENNLLRDDDFDYLENREPHKKWEHRIHGGLQSLKRNGEVVFLGDNKYKFK